MICAQEDNAPSKDAEKHTLGTEVSSSYVVPLGILGVKCLVFFVKSNET